MVIGMNNVVITIARQYGSGGRTIGEMLAKKLNVHYYDKELMKLASDDSGINEALFVNADEKVKIYVPSEKYALFKEVLSEYFGGSLLKANVSYCLNYDGNNYYYIDYYESGEKILYIPPEPQRDGYSFGGWFKETNCVNQWNFNVDTLQITKEEQEVKLYAKWIAK